MSGDVICLEDNGIPYIERDIVIRKNVSLIGYKGSPVVKFKNVSIPSDIVLCRYSDFGVHTSAFIYFENLYFEGIGAVTYARGTYHGKFDIKIHNCTFKNVPFAVVSSTSIPWGEYGNIKINISSSLFFECYAIVYAQIFQTLVLNMRGNSIEGSYRDVRKYRGIDIETYQMFRHAHVYIVETNFSYLCSCLNVYSSLRNDLSGAVRIHKSTFVSSGVSGNDRCWAPVTINLVPTFITDSKFMRNMNGAIFMTTTTAKLTNCQFLHNCGKAYYQLYATTTFTNCYFRENQASLHGAAIFNGAQSQCTCTSCIFEENYTDSYGGTIYHARDADNPLRLVNCSLVIRKKPPRYGLGGEALYLGFKATITNTTIHAPGFTSYPSQRGLLLHSFADSADVMDNVKIQCPVGWNISVIGVYSGKKSFDMLAATCSSCPPNYYSLHSGEVLFSRNFTQGYKTYHIRCLPCPYGGRCSNGIVRAQDNFWAMPINDHSTLNFVRCPVGYCCHGSQCQGYDSCSNNRVGVLCGKCKEGYSEDSLTSDCLPETNCSKIWFWVIFICAGMIYVIILMYIEEICQCLAKVLNLRKALKGGEQMNDLRTPLLSSQGSKAERIVSLASVTERSCTKESTAMEDKCLYSGLVKILFFFYQIQTLFSLTTGPNKNVKGISWVLQLIISDFFNFKIDAIYHNRVSLCPFTGLQPVTKELLKVLFIVQMIIIVGTIGFLSEIYKRKRKTPENNQKIIAFQTRIFCSLLRMLLLGYTGLTTCIMTLLRCQSLSYFGKVLFIDGNISCYTWWQYMIFALMVLWIVPFPLAIYFASPGLTKLKISFKTFFLALTFPLPFVMHSIFTFCLHHGRNEDSGLSNRLCDSGDPRVLKDQYSVDVSAVLKVLQGPFRQTSNTVAEANILYPGKPS